MRTKIQTIPDIKNMFVEMMLNKTDKVTKIADNSVLNGIAYGVAKIMQKGMKDSALIEADQFPEFAYGESLDIIAKRYGLGNRYSLLNSSLYIRVVGEVGTIYTAESNIFVTSDGLQFQAADDWSIGDSGYVYVNTKCLTQGSKTNVLPNSITKILSPPNGHKYCINEAIGVGGRDIESDDIFRARIAKGFNLLSTDTVERLGQVMIQLNNNILELKKIGKTSKGNTQLGVVTQNGILLSGPELDGLLEKSRNFLSLSDIKLFGNELIGIELINIDYTYIDLDFRIDLYQNTDVDQFVQNVQIQISKYFDWRFWNDIDKVEWDDIFLIVKKQKEVRYLPDQYFQPRSDITISKTSLPRLRGFILRSMTGDIIEDNKNVINPVYYQNYIDTDYTVAVLSNI